MIEDLKIACLILGDVYKEGTYSSIALNDKLDYGSNKAFITRLVYGVLEKDITLNYYISQLVKEKPILKAQIILKIAIYMLKFMDNIPNYAVVDECVELCDFANKPQLKGFINAVLLKSIDYKFVLPIDKFEALSVQYSVPTWLIKAYFKQYGADSAMEIISVKDFHQEHARSNKRMISDADLIKLFDRNNIEYKISGYGGYYINNGSEAVRKLFNDGIITFQSASSMIVCKALGINDKCEVLDLCSAPGGKAVYLTELAKGVKVTACDIHEHRIGLIKSYAERMKTIGITTHISDATKQQDEWLNKFDFVLCDAPCSGFGVAHKKSDIYINKSMKDVEALSETQYKIFNLAIDYLKPGGKLVYSTCTMLREENYNIIGRTLKEREDIILEKMDIDFENNGFIQLLPKDGLDGFFIAKVIKC